MPLYRIKDLERSTQPGSILMTNASGVPIYLTGDSSKDMLPVAVSGGFQLKDISNMVANGIYYDSVTHLIKQGGTLVEDTTIGGAGFDYSLTGADIITYSSGSFRITTSDQFRVVSSSTIYMETALSMTLQAAEYYMFPFGPGNNDSGWTGNVLFVGAGSRLKHGPISTTYIPEGTNLYFTTTRARQSITAGPGIVYDPITGVISTTGGNNGYIYNQTTLQANSNFNISGIGKSYIFSAIETYSDIYSFNSYTARTITNSSTELKFAVDANINYTWSVGGTKYMTLNKDSLYINATSNFGKRFYVNGAAEVTSMRTPSIFFTPLSNDHRGIQYDTNTNVVHYFSDGMQAFSAWDNVNNTYDPLFSIDANGNIRFNKYPNTRNDGSATNVLYTDASGNLKVGPLPVGSGGSDTHFANTNLTANANRTHEWAAYTLAINNTGSADINSTATNGRFNRIKLSNTGGNHYFELFHQGETTTTSEKSVVLGDDTSLKLSKYNFDFVRADVTLTNTRIDLKVNDSGATAFHQFYAEKNIVKLTSSGETNFQIEGLPSGTTSDSILLITSGNQVKKITYADLMEDVIVGAHTHVIEDITNFPAQSGNAGKWLTTNGSVLSWGTPDPGYFVETKFQVGGIGAPVDGAVTYTNTAFIGKMLAIFREGERQYEGDTVTGYTFNSTTGQITFYPELYNNERIIIQAYGTNLVGLGYLFPASVTLSGSSVMLVNDLISPGADKYYGTDSSGVKGWYDLSGVSGGGGGGTTGPDVRIMFEVGEIGYPQDEDSTYTNTELIGRAINVYREGDRQFVDTSYGISFNSATGVITFYPTLSDGEKIIIETYRLYSAVLSVTEINGAVQLLNDLASPGTSKYYGTNASGVKGWHSLAVLGSSAVWGGITGVIGDQTDLAAALAAKQNLLPNGTNVNNYLGWNGSAWIARQIDYSQIANVPVGGSGVGSLQAVTDVGRITTNSIELYVADPSSGVMAPSPYFRLEGRANNSGTVNSFKWDSSIEVTSLTAASGSSYVLKRQFNAATAVEAFRIRGNGSVAFQNAVATESYSFAFNNGSEATGVGAVNLSQNAKAMGTTSFIAGGQNHEISANTIGATSLCTDGFSFEGSNYSFICGDANVTWGYASSTHGFGNHNYGNYGFVAGHDNILGHNSTTFDNSKANDYESGTIFGSINISHTGSWHFLAGRALQASGGNNIIVFGNGLANGTKLAITEANSFHVGFGSTISTFRVHAAAADLQAGITEMAGAVKINTVTTIETDNSITDILVYSPDGTIKVRTVASLGVGGGSGPESINKVGHGFTVGMAVQKDVSGVWQRCQAVTTDNKSYADGVVATVIDSDNFTIVQAGARINTTGLGLTANTVYLLATTSSGINYTTTFPAVGEVFKELFRTNTANEATIINGPSQVVTL